MPKVKPLTDVENIPAFIQQVNSNFDKVEEALENTLSRDGSTPNEMNAVLDMNGQNIINIGGVSFVDGPAVLTDAENVLFDTPVGWIADNVQDGIEEAYQKASDETTLVENSVTTLSGNVVRVDVVQSFDPSEQTQGRDNLGLGDLAVKDSVDVADINATGTADGTTRLAGDGTWQPDLAIAIAEGAVGAPRIQPPSMAQPLVSASGQGVITSTNWLAFTGLDEVKDLRVDFHITNVNTSPQATNFEVAFSADGGSSWGSSQNILSTSDIGSSAMAHGFLRIDMESGGMRGSAFRLSIATPTTSSLIVLSTTLTVPADCNAIRFRISNGSARGLGVSIMSLGGRA